MYDVFFFNWKEFIKDLSQQEEQETLKLKDTEFAGVKLPPTGHSSSLGIWHSASAQDDKSLKHLRQIH